MAKEQRDAQEIEFLEAVEVRDHNGKVEQSFKANQVVELSDASARHWLTRGLARLVGASAEARPDESVEKLTGPALTADIAAAIGLLDPEDGFTKDGVPNVAALEAVLGYSISAAERNEAWAAVDGGA